MLALPPFFEASLLESMALSAVVGIVVVGGGCGCCLGIEILVGLGEEGGIYTRSLDFENPAL